MQVLCYFPFSFPDRPTKKQKEQHRNVFWDFTLYSDLILHVENRDLYVHREVLCTHSPVFKVMLEADFREKEMDRIPLPGKSVQQVLEMLNFIYPFGHEITGEFTGKAGAVHTA